MNFLFSSSLGLRHNKYYKKYSNNATSCKYPKCGPYLNKFCQRLECVGHYKSQHPINCSAQWTQNLFHLVFVNLADYSASNFCDNLFLNKFETTHIQGIGPNPKANATMYTHNDVNGNQPKELTDDSSLFFMKKNTPSNIRQTVIVLIDTRSKSFRPSLSTVCEDVKIATQ